MMLSLFATGKMSAYVLGVATCILPDKSQEKFIFNCEIVSSDLKRVRIANIYPTSGIKDQVGPNFEGCEIIFPSTTEGYTITSVGEHAFYACKAKVTLPESVTEIEDQAFEDYGYDGYDFALPSKVRYIGKHAFADAKIKGISLPASLQNIDDCAFRDSYLEELVLPKSTYVVGNGITDRCNKLQRLEVESGCANYSTPAGSNVIMDNKQKVVVAGCPTSKIPTEAYRIGVSAFESIKFVNETLTIPENIGVIGEAAFKSSQFKHLIIMGETVEIGERGFLGSSMERIDFYGGNVSIGANGFEICTHLESVWCHSHKPNIKPIVRQFYEIGPDWQPGNSKTKLYAKYPEEYTDRFVDIWGNETDLVWQQWFDPNIYPLDDYENVISEIHITDFDWPVAGSPCAVTATSLTKYATVSEVSYTMNGRTYDPSKPAGYNEQINVAFTITLGNAPHGQCEFTDDVKLYVDGKEADFYVTASGNTPTQKKFVFADYRVPAPPGGVPVRSVSITVPEPVEGQPLSTEVTRPTGKQYLAQGWTYSMVTWAHGADASLDSYDPTKAYTLAAIVTAKEDYCFGADCTFKLNGKEASIFRTHTAEGRERVLLTVAYGKEEPVVPDTTYITDIDIVLPEPVEGEVPASELISPTAEEMEMHGYELYNVKWYPEETPYDNSQEFEVRVRLKAKGDYTFFAPDANITINGQQATLCGNPAGYMTTNKDTQCLVFLVYEPGGNRKRGDVNCDKEVNTGDVTAVYSYIINGAGSGFDKEAADVNLDGDVNTGDVTAIYSIIINGSAE